MDFQLLSGERIIWRGEPSQGIRFHAQDWFVIPFSLLWLGLVLTIFTSTPADAAGSDPAFGFILPFFIIIGLWMLCGRFLVDMLLRNGTEYALTNRRAIIEGGLVRRSTRSINLAAAPEIRLQESGNGRGTIEFGNSPGFPFMMYRGWPGASRFQAPAFELIDDAKSVYAMILDAQQHAQSGG